MDGTLTGTPLRIRVDLEVMTIKVYSIFPTLYDWSLTIRSILMSYPGHSFGGGLTPLQGYSCMFYSLSQRGSEVLEHFGVVKLFRRVLTYQRPILTLVYL